MGHLVGNKFNYFMRSYTFPLQLTGLIDEFIAEYNKIFNKVCQDLGDLDGREVECPVSSKPSIKTERVIRKGDVLVYYVDLKC